MQPSYGDREFWERIGLLVIMAYGVFNVLDRYGSGIAILAGITCHATTCISNMLYDEFKSRNRDTHASPDDDDVD